MKDQVQASGMLEAQEVELCGSMQFGTMRSDHAKISDSSKIPGQSAFLLLGTFSFSQIFPSSVAQRFKEIEGIHRVCRSVKAKLVVREHPRGGGKDWLGPFVEELERRFPGTISLSSEPSLFKDCSSATAVVASKFDGAVLNALLSGEMVIAYVPEHSYNPTLDILEKMGCLVRTEHQLKRVLQIVGENGKEAEEIRLREDEFLKQYIDDPKGDPWIRVEELLAKVLHEVRADERPKMGMRVPFNKCKPAY
jgi:hypothetical protein